MYFSRNSNILASRSNKGEGGTTSAEKIYNESKIETNLISAALFISTAHIYLYMLKTKFDISTGNYAS